MRTRFFQTATNYTARDSYFMISRSHHHDKPKVPKAELAEFILLGIFGIAGLRSILKDGEKKHPVKPRGRLIAD